MTTCQVRLDNGTPLDVADADALRRVLREQAESGRDVPPTVHLRHGDAELIVGVRESSGVLYWLTYSDNDAVATGGTNDHPESYGLDEILFPPRSEITLDAAITAATEFYTSGRQPASITWINYGDAMANLTDA